MHCLTVLANFYSNAMPTAVAKVVELQVIFLYIVYERYVETFGGWWWSFSWLGQKVKDSMHSSAGSMPRVYSAM